MKLFLRYQKFSKAANRLWEIMNYKMCKTVIRKIPKYEKNEVLLPTKDVLK